MKELKKGRKRNILLKYKPADPLASRAPALSERTINEERVYMFHHNKYEISGDTSQFIIQQIIQDT